MFLCRSDHRSSFAGGLRTNRLILLGIGIELLLLAGICYTDLGNLVFGTAPLSWRVWLFILPFPLVMLLVEELRKCTS